MTLPGKSSGAARTVGGARDFGHWPGLIDRGAGGDPPVSEPGGARKPDGPGLTIRPAREEDAAALSRLAADLFALTYRGQIPEATLQPYLESSFAPEIQRAELADAAVVTFVACHGEHLVGYAQVWCGGPPPQGATAELELRRIYLDPAWQGRGMGRMLLGRVAQLARAKGASGVWLAVWERNESAIAFYRRSGFVEVGQQHFHMGPERQRDLVLQAPVSEL